MNDQNLQQLSAYMDGECSEVERLSMESVLADEDNLATWARYHLIGDVMRGDVPRFIDKAFSLRVRDAMASEPTVLSPQRRQSPWLKPLAGGAIAASVAVAAVVGVRNFGSFDNAVPMQASSSSASFAQAPVMRSSEPASSVGQSAQPVGTFTMPQMQWSQFDIPADAEPLPPSRSRLNSYLVNYSEQRTMLGTPGVLPYVKVVGYDSE